MSAPTPRAWPPVLVGLAIWAAVLVASTATSFVRASPLRSDSGWPLLTVWAAGLVVGLGLLAAGKRTWGAAWLVATVGGAVTYAGGVFVLLLTYGD
jgi:hypothetical protein